MLVGLAFYVINEVTGNTGQIYDWNPFVAAAAPTFAFGAFALWRLSHVR
jgi:lipopolysaccharide export LptBFGC system permease protein LptF